MNAHQSCLPLGSASKDNMGVNQVGYSVVDDHSVLRSGKLPSNFSAQTAEIVALTEACKLAAGTSVPIFTDSRYAFGVIHDFGALWHHLSFLKADGKPILNGQQVSDLLDSIDHFK